MLLYLSRSRSSRCLTRSSVILSFPKRNQYTKSSLTRDFDDRPEARSRLSVNGGTETDVGAVKSSAVTGIESESETHEQKGPAVWRPRFLDRWAEEEAIVQPVASTHEVRDSSAEHEDISNRINAQANSSSRPGRQHLQLKSLGATVRTGVTASDHIRLGQESYTSADLQGDGSFLDGLSDESFFIRTKERQGDSPVKMGKLREMMTRGDPQALFDHFCKESEDLDFMFSIPSITFIEILRQLQPKDDFAPLRGDYKAQGPKHYRILGNALQRYHAALRDRRQGYTDIIQRRLQSGRDLGVSEYTQLLHLARATWDGPSALDLMKDMLRNDIQPTLDCYNSYFEARIWADASIPHERQRFRVIPHNQLMRRTNPSRRVSGDILIDGHRVEEEGIKWEITRMFTKMIADGINPDAEAYSHLMTAQAREGDLRGMSSVLRNVWGVDTTALLQGQVKDEQPQTIARDSPVHPTENLLMVLAHAYGSNSNVPAAIRLVDHFSRRFDIPISQRVWGELLEWTYVLSTPRRKSRKTDGTATGLLPLHSVEDLWNIMRREPYCSEPNVMMYDLLIRHYARRDHYGKFIEHMHDAVRLDRRQHSDFEKQREKLEQEQSWGTGIPNKGGLLPESIELESLRTRRWLQFAMIVNWFKKLLSGRRWLHKDDRVPLWERRLLPDAVRDFWRYRSLNHVEYSMATGWVKLYEFGEMPDRAGDADTVEEPELILSDSLSEDDHEQEPVEKDQDL